MKKLLSLLLALVLCLSLCACGSGEQNNTTEEQNDAPSVEAPKELIEQISGDWAVVEPYDGAPQVINVYEGVLLTLGDEKYEMKYEEGVIFSLWWEGKDIGLVELITLPNGTINLEYKITESSLPWYGSNTCHKGDYHTTNPEQGETNNTVQTPQKYTTVEITMDNWQDYFEFKEDYLYYEDAFGDCERVEIYYILVCKNGIQIEESLSNVAVECSYTREYCYLEINPTDKTYTWSEKRTLPTDETETVEMWNVRLGGYDNVKQYGYGAKVFMFLSQGGKSQYGWVCSNFDVVRVKGSIALIGAE